MRAIAENTDCILKELRLVNQVSFNLVLVV